MPARLARRTARTPKVVIIVGATHGATADVSRPTPTPRTPRRSSTRPNVVKVYSPNATWSKVKAAVDRRDRSSSTWATATAGRARTRTTRKYTTKDGFGLNATAGNGDYNNKYYGEPYVDDARPRPERDRPAPPPVLRVGQLASRATPSRRVDRRQAARRQLRRRLPQGRRSAVIADGHTGAAYYLRGLFTTHQTIALAVAERARTTTATSSASRRRATPGATVYMDPDSPTTASTARSS